MRGFARVCHNRILTAAYNGTALHFCACESSDWHNSQYWWIQSVYVDKEHRRRGVFSLLFNTVKSECEASGGKRLSLYVEHDNHRAQQTYSKLGMKQSHYHLMQIDFDYIVAITFFRPEFVVFPPGLINGNF